MNNKTNITIPNPCPADWSQMTPNENGRHCGTCEKTVVDFTKQSPEQISEYFNQNAGKKTCGHFFKGQLKQDKNKFQAYLFNQYCNAYLNIKTTALRFAVLLILGGLLVFSGCNTPTQGEVMETKVQLTGDSVSTPNVDSLMKDSVRKGF